MHVVLAERVRTRKNIIRAGFADYTAQLVEFIEITKIDQFRFIGLYLI